MDQELGRGLTKWFQVLGGWGFSWGCSHVLGGAAVVWRSDWGGKIRFHRGSLPQLTYWCRLLAGGLISSSCGPLHRLLEFPHEIASDFPHRERSKRARWKVQGVVWSSLRSSVLTVGPGSIREGLYRGVDLRKWGWPGAFWMAALRQQLPLRGEGYFSTTLFWSSFAACFDQ